MKQTFRTKTYVLHSKKIKKGAEVRFAFLTDLHGLSFGTNNQMLYAAIMDAQPDAVLVSGDMIVSREKNSLSVAASLLLRLCDQIPVYYALGNHEYKMFLNPERREDYLNFERLLTGAGVCFLHNESIGSCFKENDFVFYGLELPMEYYHKPNSPRLSMNTLNALAGRPNREAFHVLLAHNPKYGKTYLNWGGDLILSGHYHGGILRLSENVGLSCPQFLLFPPYCCGKFEKNQCSMIVSPGIGEHTVPIRIHNPRELILIEIKNG